LGPKCPRVYGERRNDGPAIRRHPPLAQVTDRPHRQHKLLDQIGLVALEARSRRRRGLDDPILDADAGADLAAAAALALQAGPGWFGGVIHAAGFDLWPTLQPLQPRDLLTQLGIFPLQFSHLRQQAGYQLLQLARR